MKKFKGNSKLYPLVLLAAGALFLLFTGGKYNFWLTAWFPSVFFIRYFRSGKLLGRFLLALLVIWLVTLISWYGIQPLDPVSYSITMLISTIISMLPLLGDRLLYKKVPPFASTLIFPVFSTFIEYIFISGNPMGSFGSLAYSQFDNKLLIQLAGVTGILGITFLMNWFPAVVNHIWEKKSRKPAVVFSAVIAALYIYGGVVYFSAPEENEVRVSGIFKVDSDKSLRSIMSGDENERYSMADELFESYLNETINQAASGAQMVSWPEGAVITESSTMPEKENRISGLADELNIYLVVPYMVIHESSPFENKLAVFGPDGNKVLDHIKYGGNIFEGSLPGSGDIDSIDTEYGKLAAVICWDMDFPSIVSQTGRDNVDILFSPAFEWSEIVPVHAQMAVFRGIENGSSTVHTASMGLSVIADSRGKVLAEKNWFDSEDKSIQGNVPVRGRKTVYSVIGDLFPLIIMIGTALIFFYTVFLSIRNKIKKSKTDK